METTSIIVHPTLKTLRLARFYIQRGQTDQETIDMIDQEIERIQDYLTRNAKIKKPVFNPDLLISE